MSFIAAADYETCLRLHLAALHEPGPLTAPGYARRDKDLRRALGHRDPASWFRVRWEAGEAASCADHSHAAAAAANELPAAALLPTADIHLTASAALVLSKAEPADRWRVVVGMREPGELAAVAVIAARLRTALQPRLAAVEVAAAQRLLLHLACIALLRLPEIADHVDHLLSTVGKALLPLRGQEPAAAVMLEHLATTVLDQAPGEVARIASGFHPGRTDRLHRAWERGFFVPRGFDLRAWMELQS